MAGHSKHVPTAKPRPTPKRPAGGKIGKAMKDRNELFNKTKKR